MLDKMPPKILTKICMYLNAKDIITLYRINNFKKFFDEFNTINHIYQK